MKPQVATTLQVDLLRPLCVDLDGTLLRTDSLQERVLAFIRQDCWSVWKIPFWLLKGRVHLKQQLACHSTLAVETLPYSAEFLNFLKEEHRRGRRLILATAADERTAQQIAGHFPFFSEVVASDDRINMKGRRKAARLVEKFGERGFDYAGNSRADLPVWRSAGEAILVNASSGVRHRAVSQGNTVRTFNDRVNRFASLAQVMRVHQWPKNFLLLAPIVSGHELFDADIMCRVVLAIIAFCLCASSVYVVNDLHDLDVDRAHRVKQFRPFASGQLPISAGFFLAPTLLGLGFSCAVFLPSMFILYLTIYYFASNFYSWKLKKIALLDVFLLAGLYTLRILAGHGATGIGYSNWLLGFSMFLFLSLALLKRYVELHRLGDNANADVAGRGYRAGDITVVFAFGLVCGALSALVLALYINSNEVRLLYHRPWLLLFICPLMLYWTARAWLLASRDQLHDDPVVFALKDKTTYLVGIVAAFFVWMATISW